MDPKLIAAVEALPGEAPTRIARELDAFNRLRGVDPEMACVRAQRAADVIARHVYARVLDSKQVKSMREMLGELLRGGHVPYEVGVALETVRSIGQIAASAAMQEAEVQDEIVPADLQRCSVALTEAAEWLAANGKSFVAEVDVENTLVIPDRDVTLDDVMQTVKIDEDCYGSVEATYVATEAHVQNWYYACSAVYTLLKDQSTGRIVGYINAMPVTKETFDQILTGYFNESEFGLREIEPYTRPGFYYLYFCSVGILSEYRNMTNLRKLLDGFLAKWAVMAHQNIFLRAIVADAVTPEGTRLCEAFGMRKVGVSDRGSAIYRVSTMPPEFPPVTPNSRALRDFYAQVYLRFKAQIDASR